LLKNDITIVGLWYNCKKLIDVTKMALIVTKQTGSKVSDMTMVAGSYFSPVTFTVAGTLVSESISVLVADEDGITTGNISRCSFEG
jgi:hypothetical protein